MRFFLQIGLLSHADLSSNVFTPHWLDKLLPVKNHLALEGIDLMTFHYETDDKSIVEANWDEPFYYNNEYFIFISGHVFYRIHEADKKGKYVPTPHEVLEILLKHGDGHYDLLKGNYHIILFDRIRNSATVYSSPLSLYPAWYMVQDDKLYVSNLMESLIRMKKGLSIDSQGLVEFSLFDHCLDARTIYKDIFLLVGGNRLDINEKEKSEALIYDIKKWITKTPLKRKDSLGEINQRLKRHITEYTESVKKFNISLTGGFDGRLNFSFIKKSDYPRLQAFSYGMKDSLQLIIPKMISNKLNFRYKEIQLEQEFENQYASLGMETITYTGGITPFMRANYPFGYGKITNFSRNCILGQCDMIRPLFNNPAGSIFNNFSHDIFYNEDPSSFREECKKLAKNGFLDESIFSNEIIENIEKTVKERYIEPYTDLNNHEKFFLFLYKESILKYWHTECHVVDLFVNDFISFSDLDYIESLSKSEYFGLYKGIFATNQFKRRKGQDLYADLMYLNNNDLNDIILDRLYKPKWLRKTPVGYLMIALGKWNANRRRRRIGNDTFGGVRWSNLFYHKYVEEINQPNRYFNLNNLKNNKPYLEHHNYRYDRNISLKLWLQYLGIQ